MIDAVRPSQGVEVFSRRESSPSTRPAQPEQLNDARVATDERAPLATRSDASGDAGRDERSVEEEKVRQETEEARRRELEDDDPAQARIERRADPGVDPEERRAEERRDDERRVEERKRAEREDALKDEENRRTEEERVERRERAQRVRERLQEVADRRRELAARSARDQERAREEFHDLRSKAAKIYGTAGVLPRGESRLIDYRI